MTKNLEDILKFYAAYIEQNGYAPSVPHVKGETGIALSTISRSLKVLEDAGFIRVGGRRAIAVTPRGYEIVDRMKGVA